MQIENTESQWGIVQQTLHWVVVLAVMIQLNIGFNLWRMTPDDPQWERTLPIHAGIGLAILALMLYRLYWRRQHAVPKLPDTLSPGEKALAHATHSGLYGLLIAMPIVGYFLVSAHGQPVPFFNAQLPALIGENETLQHSLKGMHILGAMALVLLLSMHVLAGLRHAWSLRDGVMVRMAPFLNRESSEHSRPEEMSETGKVNELADKSISNNELDRKETIQNNASKVQADVRNDSETRGSTRPLVSGYAALTRPTSAPVISAPILNALHEAMQTNSQHETGSVAPSPVYVTGGTLMYLLPSPAKEIAMFQVNLIRLATVTTLSVLLFFWGGARAGQDLKVDATTLLEVRVLEARISPGQGARDEVIYRMEVISVLRSTSRVKPGDTIVVRAYTFSKEALDRGAVDSKAPALLAPGWLGVAYLNPDPKASGPEARGQFAIAANGDSFEDIPPGPPAVRWTKSVEGSAE